MFTEKKFLVAASLACTVVLFLSVTVASAGLLNPSFESPDVGTNNSVSEMPDNWQNNGISAWIDNGTGGTGDGMSAPADGHQFVEVKRTEGNDVGDLWQNTHIGLQNGATYAFTFAVNPGNSDAAAGYSMLRAASYDLADEGAGFGDQAFPALPKNTWTTLQESATYTGASGEYLVVGLRSYDSIWCGYDATSVTVTPSPEPSVLVLLATGLLGLLAYAWRKRR